MFKSIVSAIAAGMILSAPAVAAQKEVIQPVQVGEETIRYEHGEYLLELDRKELAVQIAPMPKDHSNISFSVMVLNKSDQPFNLDVSNIRVEGTAVPVRLLTKDEMVRKAESRAAWATALTALAGGFAAGSMANQRDTYRATTFTPRGHAYTTYVDAPCSGCQVAAAATVAATGYSIARIQGALDETREALGSEMLQLTTVDPGRTYGGRVFLSKFKRKPMSEMRLILTIDGRDYPFGFRFAKPGTPPSPFKVTAPPPAENPEPASETARSELKGE